MAPSPEKHKIDAAAVKASVSILGIARKYGLQLQRKGREYSALSPFKAERTPSFFIDDRKGLFKCFASGEGGDVIRFVQLMEACDFHTALGRLCGDAGLDDPLEREKRARAYERRRKSAEQDAAEKAARAIRGAALIWGAAMPAAGTPVETYLRSRGIDLDALAGLYGWRVPPSLRWHPHVSYAVGDGRFRSGPAMIGIAVRDIRGRRHLAGVHRTWLAEDGSGKADIDQPKKTLGQMSGAYTQLSPICDEAVIGEGYETVLSVMAALAKGGRRICGISGLFLGNICGAGLRRDGAPRGEIPIEPDPKRPGMMLPERIRRVILLKDADGKRPDDTDRFLRRAATKFQRAGLVVLVASPTIGDDFNDRVRVA